MYGTILVAIDQSEHSERVIAAARGLALATGDSVRLLHVAEKLRIVGKGGGSYEMEEPGHAEDLFAKEVATFNELQIPVVSELRHASVGHAAREIVAAARECGAGIIVIGSRGFSELAALVLGSTAYKVLHLADGPVLVVH